MLFGSCDADCHQCITLHRCAEEVRDRGGHCLLIIDDMSPLSSLWDTLAITGLSGLGRDVVGEGCVCVVALRWGLCFRAGDQWWV